MAIADRIVVMNAGEIEDIGAPARIYNDPRTVFTAQFLGEINVIDGVGDNTRIKTALGPIPHGVPGNVKVAIRPEHMMIGGPVDLGTATVTDVSFFGTFCRLTLQTAAGPVHAQTPPDHAPQTGDTISLRTNPKHIKVFPT